MKKKQVKKFIDMLLMNQEELFNYVIDNIPNHCTTVYEAGKYIYVKSGDNEDKPLLTSHLDTVDDHSKNRDILRAKDIINDNGVLSVSPFVDKVLGGDDRAGVYIMLELMKKDLSNSYDYIFFCDEEIGGLGSSYYSKTFTPELEQYTCFISLDRRGKNDVATYGYDNTDLIQVFEDRGYKEAFGSYTDCVECSEESKIACVNLSVGYDNEHTSRETQDITIIDKVIELLSNKEVISSLSKETFEYEEVDRWTYSYDDIYDMEQEYIAELEAENEYLKSVIEAMGYSIDEVMKDFDRSYYVG